MKAVAAFSRHCTHGQLSRFIRRQEERPERTKTAVIAWVFASRTGAVKVNLADTTDIVFRYIPAPCRDGVPICDGDLHGVCSPSTSHVPELGSHPLTVLGCLRDPKLFLTSEVQAFIGFVCFA